MKRLLIGVCLLLGCVWSGQTAMGQSMANDLRTMVWQHDEAGGAGRTGNWGDLNWADKVAGGLSSPSADFNAFVSGFDTAATITIPKKLDGSAEVLSAQANQLLLYTSNLDSNNPLTLKIQGNSQFASISAESSSPANGHGIVIEHTRGNVTLTGSQWSNATDYDKLPSGEMVLSSLMSPNSTTAWEGWYSRNCATILGTMEAYIAWDSSAMAYPLIIDGWSGEPTSELGADVAAYLESSYLEYMAKYPDSPATSPYQAWEDNNFRNPLMFNDATKTWNNEAGYFKADTPGMYDTSNPLLPSSLADNYDYVLKEDADGNLVMIHWDHGSTWWIDQAGEDTPFGYLTLGEFDPGGEEDGPVSAVLQLGVTSSTTGNQNLNATYRFGTLGDNKRDRTGKVVSGVDYPTLKASALEIVGNGRNTFEAKGGILEVGQINFKPDSETGTQTEANMTFRNEGSEIRFATAKKAGVGNLMTVAGNYSNVGDGTLRMRAYGSEMKNEFLKTVTVETEGGGTENVDVYTTADKGFFYLDKSGNLVPTADTDGSAYVLFNSDVLKVTQVASGEGFADGSIEAITGFLTTGGNLLLDVTDIANFSAMYRDDTDGIALKLFDVKEDGIRNGAKKLSDGKEPPNSIDNPSFFDNIILGKRNNKDDNFSNLSTMWQTGDQIPTLGEADGENPLIQMLADAGLGPNAASDVFLYALSDQYLMSDGIMLLGWGAPLSSGVPEPSTIVLLLMGAAGLFVARKRRKA